MGFYQGNGNFAFILRVVTQVDFLLVPLTQQPQQPITPTTDRRGTASHQQDREIRVTHQMVGDASKHHSAQSSATVSAHYHQVVRSRLNALLHLKSWVAI